MIITDIDIQNDGIDGCVRVTVRFCLDMAENWMEKYSKQHHECKFVTTPSAETV